MTAIEKADVIIAGAGPNGLAMALALGGGTLTTPLDVVVIDAGDPRARLSAYQDTRGSALTTATQELLRALGAFDALVPHLQEMRQVRVTDGTGPLSGRLALLSFATTEGERAAAAIVENRHLAAALLGAVEASPQIRLVTGSVLQTLEMSSARATVRCANGRCFTAPLLIGADGRNSAVRQATGLGVDREDYDQTALTFTLAHELPHGGGAEEHFTPDGVIAFLPLPGNRSSIVWGTSPGRAQSLLASDVSTFEAEVNDMAGSHLGRLTLEGERQAYPLTLQVAKAIVAARVALIGDAAHVVHPLAGLGLNLGFKDVAALAECVHEAVARGEDHGNDSVLERYVRWRRFDTAAALAMINGLNGLFVNNNPFLKALRDIGLRAVDRSDELKSLLMQEASGLVGDVPRLMRGIAP